MLTGTFRSFRSIATAFALSAFCVGCSSPTAEEVRPVVAIIAPSAAVTARVIVAPDTVRAGESFTAIITTFGSSTCTRSSSSTASVASALVDVSVWDYVSGRCSQDLSPIPRTMSLQFTSVGAATIRVRGQAQARAASGQDSLVVLERQVIVR